MQKHWGKCSCRYNKHQDSNPWAKPVIHHHQCTSKQKSHAETLSTVEIKNPYSHVVDSSTSSVWSRFGVVTCLRRSPFHRPSSWLLAARCTHFLLFQCLLHLWRGKYIWKRNNAVVHVRACVCVCACALHRHV